MNFILINYIILLTEQNSADENISILPAQVCFDSFFFLRADGDAVSSFFMILFSRSGVLPLGN